MPDYLSLSPASGCVACKLGGFSSTSFLTLATGSIIVLGETRGHLQGSKSVLGLSTCDQMVAFSPHGDCVLRCRCLACACWLRPSPASRGWITRLRNAPSSRHRGRFASCKCVVRIRVIAKCFGGATRTTLHGAHGMPTIGETARLCPGVQLVLGRN